MNCCCGWRPNFRQRGWAGRLAPRIRALLCQRCLGPARTAADRGNRCWQTLNSDGSDPQAGYARANSANTLAERIPDGRTTGLWYAMGHGSRPSSSSFSRAVSSTYRSRCSSLAGRRRDSDLQQAWQLTNRRCARVPPPLARRFPPTRRSRPGSRSPRGAPDAEAAPSPPGWRLNCTPADAPSHSSRSTAKRAPGARAARPHGRAGVPTKPGWTLVTTAAAAVIDRWLECVAGDFPTSSCSTC